MPGAIENRMDVYCKLNRKWVMRRNECSGWSNVVYDDRVPEKILVKAKYLYDIARLLSILEERFSLECTDEVASELLGLGIVTVGYLRNAEIDGYNRHYVSKGGGE